MFFFISPCILKYILDHLRQESRSVYNAQNYARLFFYKDQQARNGAKVFLLLHAQSSVGMTLRN
jgi:hypothetical protein